MEIAYWSLIGAVRALFFGQGLTLIRKGEENIPETGGAVIAMNHIGYFDFTFGGYVTLPRRRLVRFMAKKEVFDHRIAGPAMRHFKHIPVDRKAGSDAYAAAVQALRAGELIGVFPEATISRSFELKSFKAGAARMAQEAGVPVIPVAFWGSQRVWTKGKPKRLGRTNTPIMFYVGEPFHPTGTPTEGTAQIKERIQALLDAARADYPDPHPAGEFWVPAAMGGGAPTLGEATELDRAEGKLSREQ